MPILFAFHKPLARCNFNMQTEEKKVNDFVGFLEKLPKLNQIHLAASSTLA